ncbi:thioredoxin-like protein [Chlamydoabsidia padenii]|nr:thioredoxin-like protein [Chlamydoabsidia padenii]
MNSLRLSAKALPLRSLTARSFHTNQPCFTGKTFETDSQNFDKAVLKADHPVLVDFYADWCGPCKMLGPILSKTVEANPKVSLFKINVDDNMDIGQQYNISSLPTVVAFHKGEIVDSFVGMSNKSKVQAFVEAHAKRAD